MPDYQRYSDISVDSASFFFCFGFDTCGVGSEKPEDQGAPCPAGTRSILERRQTVELETASFLMHLTTVPFTPDIRRVN